MVGAPVFLASSSAGEDDAGNLHEIDGVVLRPLTERKGCLFWLEQGLCTQWVESFSREYRVPDLHP